MILIKKITNLKFNILQHATSLLYVW